MSVWNIEESAETTASAEQIWKLWSKPSTWPKWDDSVEWVKFEGAFIQGNKGVMKPVGGPEVAFELSEVEVNKSFRDRTFLPLTTLDFFHFYVPATEGKKARIIHRVEMRGLLTPIFKRVVGSKIQKGLPHAVRSLIAQAQESK